MVTTYAEFAPTGFDARGLGLPDQQDWLVAPCAVNRDSGTRSKANWQAQQTIVSEAGLESEVHRFGHWANGWFELLLVAPSEAAVTCLEGIEGALADYPILDDSLCDDLEWSECLAAWESWGAREFILALVETFELSDATETYIASESFAGDLLDLACSYSGGMRTTDDISHAIRSACESARLDRDTFAQHILLARRSNRNTARAMAASTEASS